MCVLSFVTDQQRYHPDGFLPAELQGHDVDAHRYGKAGDLFSSDELNAFYLQDTLLQSTITDESNIMSTGDDDSGLNGRLRPRKSNVLIPPNARVKKPDVKSTPEQRSKRTTTPSKVTPAKHDDLANNSDDMPTLQLLCPYCDRKFSSKQNLSNHTRRTHIPALKQNNTIACLYCSHNEPDSNEIIRHMVDNHPNHYFACLDCNSRFLSTSELADHRLNVCEKQRPTPTIKTRTKNPKLTQNIDSASVKEDYRADVKEFPDGRGFNGIVISCELKPAQGHDEADIEDNITTNLILPPNKPLSNAVMEKNAVIVLDDIQWTKRLPPNFSFHNSDADQILSRLGVVHKSPRGGEFTKKDWFKILDEANQKFERCFDTSFYSKVASNVQENLNKFLDGSFNFNPDPDAMIKTRKSKFSVAINTAEGFPILLASEQYTRNVFERYIPRSIAPKHKWKWDSIESDRNPLNPDQIKRDSHTNNCIITLVSGLDIWTQLCMRRKFEEKFNNTPVGKKTEKQNSINLELKEILESRDLPSTSSKHIENSPSKSCVRELPPPWLGLCHTKAGEAPPPAVLSGEWVRPRCYVCCACGAQTRDPRAVSAHINTHHPNAQVQHYEIVGDRLLKSDILRHLYVPPSQMVNRTRPPRGFKDCTKCNKAVSLEELHQHMLECAGDSPTVRRKVRPRPFGTRRRRPRLPDNTIRKKIRKQLRPRHSRQKTCLRRTLPKIRSEVGDAETIRKMIADLPAKRHRVTLNPENSIVRPQRNIDKQQRNKLLLKRRGTEELRHRRLRAVRNAASSLTESSVSVDESKQQNEEDEDSTPAKPRFPRMSTRRMEALKASKQKVFAGKPLRIPSRSRGNNLASEPGDNKNKPGTDEQTDANKEGSDQQSNTSNKGAGNMPLDNIAKIAESGESLRGRQQGRRGTPTQGSRNNPIDNPQRINMGGQQSWEGQEYERRETPTRGGRGGPQHSRGGWNTGGEAPVRNNPSPQRTPPLKHSIARLCGNLETHDKSVQFQPMFLMQQECNNAPRHLPTGQQLLFENEAVLTKVDKPPIYDYKGGTDERAVEVCSFKTKQNNKPRKGLNDCIAMLMNKLVEPVPLVNQEHVSVQCGFDTPLENTARPDVLPDPKGLYYESPPPCPPINSIDQVRCIDTMDTVRNDGIAKFGYNLPLPSLPVTYPTQFVQQPTVRDPVFKTPPKRGAKGYTAPPKKKTPLVLPRRESIRRKAAIRAESEIQKQKYNELAAQASKYSDFYAVKHIVPPKHYKSDKIHKSLTGDKPPKNVQKFVEEQSKAQNKIKALEAFVRPLEPLSVKTSDKVRVLDSIPVQLQDPLSYNSRYKTLNKGLPKKMRAASIPRNMDPSNLLPDRAAMRRYSLDITNQYNMNTQLSPQLQVHNLINHSPNVTQHSPREANYRTLHSPLQGKVNVSPIDETFWNQQPGRKESSVSPRIHHSPKDSMSGYQHSYNYNIGRTHQSPNELYSSMHFEKDYMSDLSTSRLIQYSPRESNSVEKDSQLSYEERRGMEHPRMLLPRSAYARRHLAMTLDPNAIDERTEYSSTLPLDLSGKSEIIDMSKPLITEEKNATERPNEKYTALKLSNKPFESGKATQKEKEDEANTIVDLRVKIQKPQRTQHFNQTRSSEKLYSPTDVCHKNYEPGLADSNTYTRTICSKTKHSGGPTKVNYTDLDFLPPIDVHYPNDSMDMSHVVNVENKSSANEANSSRGLPEDKTITVEPKKCKTEEPPCNYDHALIAPHNQISLNPEPVEEDTVEEIIIIEVSQVPVISPPVKTQVSQPQTTVSVSPISTQSAPKVFENFTEDIEASTTNLPLSQTENTVSVYTLKNACTSVTTIEASKTASATENVPTMSDNTENLYKTIIKDDKTYMEHQKEAQPTDIEQDPEVAKKIELLPGELKEIIGNMPPDHRNKLLNVLPQYVSTSKPTKEKEFEQTANNAARTGTFEKSTDSVLDYQLTSENSYIPLDQASIKVEHSVNVPLELKFQAVQFVEECSTKVPIYNTIQNNVIDLTNDDLQKVAIDGDSNETNSLPQFESTTNIALTPQLKPRSNHEQTASLRAVRIKPALERQKNSTIKPVLVEHTFLEPITVDNNIPKQTPGVPQFEDSSEQCNYGNTVTNIVSVIATNQDESLKHPFTCNNNDENQPKNEEVVESSPKKTEDNKLATKISEQKTETVQIESNQTVTVKDHRTSLTEQCKDADSQKTVNDENKVTEETDSFLDSTPIENCLPLDNSTPKRSGDFSPEKILLPVTTGTPKNEVSVPNDDDSDDDISLALIVKQRQKNDIISKPAEDAKASSKRKNKKRSKKKTTIKLLDNTLEVTTGSELLSGKDCMTVLNCKNETDSKVHPKEKSKKSKRLTNKSSKTSDNVPQEIPVIENMLNNLEYVVLDEPKINVTPDDKTKNVLVNLDSSSPKEKVTTLVESIFQKTQDDNLLSVGSGPGHIKYDLDGESKHIKEISEILEETQDISKDSGTNITETSLKTCKKRHANFGDESFDSILSQDLKEPISKSPISLRRSKRGKSLYKEDAEILCIKIKGDKDENKLHDNSEVKAPLTKKQLIFFKLLHDESCKLSETHNVEPENDSVIDATDSNEDFNSTTEIEKPQDKLNSIKSVKRKKSPQSKQKNKKNKTESAVDPILAVVGSDDTKNDGNVPTQPSSQEEECIVLQENESVVAITKGIIDKKNINTSIKSDKEEDKNIETATRTESKTLASGEKRKIDINLTENLHEPKKLRISNEDTDDNPINLPPANEIKMSVEIRSTCYSQGVSAIRRLRSKSVGLKCSNPDTYDPYDIDLDEMIENPEPCEKKKTHSKSGNNRKNPKGLSKTKEVKVKTIEKTIGIEDKAKTDSAEGDSDSSQSDIPLNKLVKDKGELSNKRQEDDKTTNNGDSINNLDKGKDLLSHTSQNIEPKLDNSELQDGIKNLDKGKEVLSNTRRKGYKKTNNKKSQDSKISKTQTNSEEQLRSDKFMESFGFFSERKPRKSNLLAAKKIAETFHIIESEEYDTKREDEKRKSSNETKKLKDSVKTATRKSTRKKQPTNEKQKVEPKNKTRVTCFCIYCIKIFRRQDNYIRHQMSKYHITKMAETEFKYDTNLIIDTSNALVVFKQQIDKHTQENLNLEQNIQPQRKVKNIKKPKKPKEKSHVFQDILNNAFEIVKEEDTHMTDTNRDEILFLKCCQLIKQYRQICAVKVYLDNYTISMCPLELTSASSSNDDKNDGGAVANGEKNIPEKQQSSEEGEVKVELEEAKSKLNEQQLQEYEKSTLLGTMLDISKIRALCGEDFILTNLPKLAKIKRHRGPIAYTDKITVPRRKVPVAMQKSNKSLQDIRTSKHSNMSTENVQNKTVYDEPKPGTSRDANAELEKLRVQAESKIADAKKRESQTKKKRRTRSKCEPKPGTSKKFEKNETKPSVTEAALNHILVEEPIKYPEYKEKMYPDIVIEDIDMLEDKFDKIKRKCRSQAAAAKQTPTVVECTSIKSRKKCEKKRIKKKTKKSHHISAVLTKGALKGFDGIKVSIPTADDNMTAVRETPKKKKKSGSKKKRDQRNSVASNKHENDPRGSNYTSSQKKVDVYEFMDNEDAELFELRPSTLMERFKSLCSKDNVNSEPRVAADDVDVSGGSGSDEDDFVYMSDDYVCSDDETENSLMSCELGNNKHNVDAKKVISPKKKDTVDKSAVMGKIFKNNAVRSDKKSAKSKETAKSKTNLDQLFDSLLKNEKDIAVEQEIKSKTDDEELLLNEEGKSSEESSSKILVETSTQYEPLLIETEATSPKKDETTATKAVPTLPVEKLCASTAGTSTSRRNTSISPRIRAATPKKIENYSETNSPIDDSFSRISQDLLDDDDIHAPSTSRKYLLPPLKEHKHMSRKLDFFCSTFESSRNRATRYDDFPLIEPIEFTLQKHSSKKCSRLESPSRDHAGLSGLVEDGGENRGVARQRARRKCAVGKQNVLAESWSSESDADGAPRAPNAASIAAAAVRRKKAKRRDAASASRRKVQSKKTEESSSAASAWPADPDGHVQQHGWIVGDSHKKLVTMLAHAKGRKRTSDDDRNDLD